MQFRSAVSFTCCVEKFDLRCQLTRVVAACGILFLILTPLPIKAKKLLVKQERQAVAPPPLRTIPSEDQQQLDAKESVKDRLKISLKLATARLAKAEQLTSAQQYPAASGEIGAYQALIEDALQHVQTGGAGDVIVRVNNRQRDLLKRFEQTLRGHNPRLEALRRTTPAAYAVHIEATIESVKRSRSRALNLFFGEGTMNREPARNVDENIDGTSGDSSNQLYN